MSGNQVRPNNPFTEFKSEDIEQSIPTRFERMVETNPDRLAIKYKNHALTYQELNQAANRVAHAILAKRGEGEEPVAVLIDNPMIMITAILGTMKAGKICVPLDPQYPQERTAYILAHSGSPLSLTTAENRSVSEGFAGQADAVIFVDRLDSGISDENPNLPIPAIGPSYILYTSGSTGQPKGVIHLHRNRVQDTSIYTNRLHISCEDRIVLFYSCSSGQGMATTWCALLNGATLLPYQLREEGTSTLADWLCQEKISIYFSIPSVFRQLAERLTGKEDFSQLRIVHVGTERVTKQDVALFQTRFPSHCVFVTGLASNETGRSRQFLLDHRTRIDENIVPVGYAVEGKEILLLDEDGQEAGYNRTGEIVIRSKYLSPGYWKQPELTHAVFRPDPSGGEVRRYFTGDMGVMRPDGCLILMGRKDFQAKIRGFRVEFAEIEATLLNSGLVKEAVVVARDNGRGSKDLVAYTVPSEERSCSTSELRRKIQEKLPDYMVPTYFIALESLPHTPTGKLDRRALPDPDSSRPKLNTPFVAPQSPIEEELAQIWSKLLSLDQVGVNDPFLELGGDSLRATQLISRILDRFQVEMPVQALMESSTITEMAEAILNYKSSQIGPEEMERLLDEVESSSSND